MSDSPKVVSLLSKKQEKAEAAAVENDPAAAKSKEELDSEAYFADVQKKNKEKEDRIRKEKLAANKSVLRSYRIKH